MRHDVGILGTPDFVECLQKRPIDYAYQCKVCERDLVSDQVGPVFQMLVDDADSTYLSCAEYIVKLESVTVRNTSSENAPGTYLFAIRAKISFAQLGDIQCVIENI